MTRVGQALAMLATVVALLLLPGGSAEASTTVHKAAATSSTTGLVSASRSTAQDGGWSDEATVNTAGFGVFAAAAAAAAAFQNGRGRKKAERQERKGVLDALAAATGAVDTIVLSRDLWTEYEPDNAAIGRATNAISQLETQTTTLLPRKEVEHYTRLAWQLLKKPGPEDDAEKVHNSFHTTSHRLAVLIEKQPAERTSNAA